MEISQNTQDTAIHSPKVAVVIPNYNGVRFLPDCMEALTKQTFTDFETIVVDNGSVDEDIDWLTRWQKDNASDRFLILNRENLGFSAAVNAGIRKAMAHHCPYTVLLNNDTKIAPDFLKVLVKRMEKDKKKRIFALSSKMVKLHDPSIMDDAGDQYTVLGWQFQRGLEEPAGANASCPESVTSSMPHGETTVHAKVASKTSVAAPSNHPQKKIEASKWNRPALVFSACAGAAMYRTEAFWKVGLFDEHHFAYLEDLDVSYRAQLYGYRILYYPRAVCLHVGSGTSGSKYNSFKVRLSARNSVYLIYKNMPAPMIAINALPLLTGFLIKQIFFMKKGFGADYAFGILEALKTCHILKNANFDEVPFTRYLRIEGHLIAATFEYAAQLARKTARINRKKFQ